MKFPLPLRYSVPAVLFLAGLILGVVSFYHEQKLAHEHVEKLLNRHVQFIGNQISGIAEYCLQRNDPVGLKKHISALGSDPVLRFAFVCDDQNRILVSSRYEFANRPLDVTPLGYASSLLRDVKRSTTRIDADGTRLLGIFPVLLPPKKWRSPRHSPRLPSP